MFSDPKYSFSVCPKNFFLLQFKINIFHQIQPIYNVYSVDMSWTFLKIFAEKHYSAAHKYITHIHNLALLRI